MKYWLLKSEPDVYSIDNLRQDQKTSWEGVRNYQARNFMMNEMQRGDLAFFYHSNAEPSGIVGLMRVVSDQAHADNSAQDKQSKYFDPKASHDKPIWFCADFEYVQTFTRTISLEELRRHQKLAQMLVLKKGQRLSVQPVSKEEFEYICALAKKNGNIHLKKTKDLLHESNGI